MAAEIVALGLGFSQWEATRALLAAKAAQDSARGLGGRCDKGETVFQAINGGTQSVVLSREEALKNRAVDWLLSGRKG